MAKFIKIINEKQTNNLKIIHINAISKIIATHSDTYDPPYSEICSIHLIADKEDIKLNISLNDLMDFLAKAEDSQDYIVELSV